MCLQQVERVHVVVYKFDPFSRTTHILFSFILCVFVDDSLSREILPQSSSIIFPFFSVCDISIPSFACASLCHKMGLTFLIPCHLFILVFILLKENYLLSTDFRGDSKYAYSTFDNYSIFISLHLPFFVIITGKVGNSRNEFFILLSFYFFFFSKSMSNRLFVENCALNYLLQTCF